VNLLINPSSMIQLGYTPPPLGLLFLAATDKDTRIIDMARYPNFDIEAFLDKEKPVVVGVPIYTVGRKESFRLLSMAKTKGAITVAGGPHVDIMRTMKWKPFEKYPYIDVLVFGDGEAAWKHVCDQANAITDPLERRWAIRDLMYQTDPKNPPNLDTLSLPAYEKIDYQSYPDRVGTMSFHRGHYLNSTPRYSVVFGRGCDGDCTFCSTWWVHGKYHHHGIEWMRKHFDQLTTLGAQHLCFQDDCLTVDKPASLQLFKLMEEYNFSCFGSTRVDHMDDELAQASARAGFYEWSFGIESGSQKMLDIMHKRTDLGAAFYARDAVRRAGMRFTALMIQGFPHETDETRRETEYFMSRLQPDGYGSLGHTMILPGTKLYQECKKAGLLNDDFWLTDEPYYVYRGGL
jgi:radical SAM superfamily enzyme YgiQ (UPF0313 family)